MIVEHLVVGALGCNCTILGDERSGEAAIVDGGDDVDAIVERLTAHGLRAKYLLHTHAHFDHIAAVGALRERTGGAAMLHPADVPLYHALAEQPRWVGLAAQMPPVVRLDGDLRDGDTIALGEARIAVHHTPGHTPGSTSFAFSIDNESTLLTGDTLFRGSIGRWDLGGTSQEDIVRSIRAKLLVYADSTTVIPGHGAPTTVGIERRTNPYLQEYTGR